MEEDTLNTKHDDPLPASTISLAIWFSFDNFLNLKKNTYGILDTNDLKPFSSILRSSGFDLPKFKRFRMILFLNNFKK